LNGEKRWGESRRKVLSFLEENAGGKVRIREIAEKTGVKKGSIYGIISDLRP